MLRFRESPPARRAVFHAAVGAAALALTSCDRAPPRLVPARLALAAAAPAARADEPPRPARNSRGTPEVADRTRRDFDSGCLRSGCHSQLAKTPFVHGPTAVGACDACHTAEGPAENHRFRPTRAKDQACAFCHRAPPRDAHVHQAFADGDCTGCHDPHGGRSAALLDTEDEARLCGACHRPDHHPPPQDDPKLETPRFAVIHRPIDEKRCLVCHAAHQSAHPALTRRPERELCLSCHEETLRALQSGAHVHKPLETECRACHVAHGSDTAHLLRGEPRALCVGCHEDVAKEPAAGTHAHGALAEAGSCLTCHVSHVAPTKALAREPLANACYSCHDREIALGDGRKIADVRTEISRAKHPHGPVASGDCAACHRSHSSPHDGLLARTFAREPYVEFREDAYALCFDCHDARLATDETTTSTGFRDGSRNLHYVHTNRAKGRSCGLCHTTHAGDLPRQMRHAVAFGPGNWQLPIGFELTAAGGSCRSGCHREIGYDNRQPPPTLPAPRSSIRPSSPEEASGEDRK